MKETQWSHLDLLASECPKCCIGWTVDGVSAAELARPGTLLDLYKTDRVLPDSPPRACSLPKHKSVTH